MVPTKLVHLMSGGLDSTVMLYDLHRQGFIIHCLLFDYGQKAVKELEYAERHCNRLGVAYTRSTLPTLRGSELTNGDGGVVVPNRNAILLSVAVSVAVAADAERVTFAANADDEPEFPDCRQAFLKAMNKSVEAAGYKVEICAPYLEKSKRAIVTMSKDLAVPIADTWSCYEAGQEPCGECMACEKRSAAMQK